MYAHHQEPNREANDILSQLNVGTFKPAALGPGVVGESGPPTSLGH